MRRNIDSDVFSFSRRLRGGHALLALICLTPLSQAQTKPTAPPSHRNIQPASRPPDDSQKEILSLRQEIEEVKTKLGFDEMILKTKQDRSDTINLDLTQKTYQRLDTDNGFFLISVEEAEPYLNGYKIHISIGNPSYATYTNYTLKVRYSKSFDWTKYTEASYDEWNKAIQEKAISYPDSLQPGTWNGVDVILAPVTADQIGFLTLSMTASTIRMNVR